MSHPPRVVLVVAVAENGVIGSNGALPWRLKSDMAFFKSVTMNRPLLMGRKTWDSLPRKPLPGRTNVVLTRDASFAATGALVATSLEAALAAARGDALRRGVDEIAVIGGSDIFALTMPLADRIEFTRVHASPKGDTTFPELPAAMWREAARRDFPAGPNDDARFTILTYERVKAA
ncbi:MAG: dihydrofolate reductase [Xanthobacteraceae bacterium]